jgi:hypothetical protein
MGEVICSSPNRHLGSLLLNNNAKILNEFVHYNYLESTKKIF